MNEKSNLILVHKLKSDPNFFKTRIRIPQDSGIRIRSPGLAFKALVIAYRGATNDRYDTRDYT